VGPPVWVSVIGLGLALIPFVLFYYGPTIRDRSRFGKRLARMAEEAAQRVAREQEIDMALWQAAGEGDATGAHTLMSEASVSSKQIE
jgi:hypothetical protein